MNLFGCIHKFDTISTFRNIVGSNVNYKKIFLHA